VTGVQSCALPIWQIFVICTGSTWWWCTLSPPLHLLACSWRQ